MSDLGYVIDRLRQLLALLADLNARLPGAQRELEAIIAEVERQRGGC